jgi:hypothetical protein
MVMMFVGGGVLVIDGDLVLFLLWKSYGVGVFVPAVGDLAILKAIFFQLLAVFWHLSICISLFAQTNKASTCMFICQTNMDIQIDKHVE